MTGNNVRSAAALSFPDELGRFVRLWGPAVPQAPQNPTLVVHRYDCCHQEVAAKGEADTP